MSKVKTSAAVDKIVAEVKEQVSAAIAEAEAVAAKDDGGRLGKLNSKGEMLKCALTLSRRPGAPDPLCITVNEDKWFAKRGKEVTVPWYVVAHLKNNIERLYRQEKDEQGKSIVVGEDMPAEPFSYRMIDPAPGVEV